MAAKLADNKTLFCHSERSEESQVLRSIKPKDQSQESQTFRVPCHSIFAERNEDSEKSLSSQADRSSKG